MSGSRTNQVGLTAHLFYADDPPKVFWSVISFVCIYMANDVAFGWPHSVECVQSRCSTACLLVELLDNKEFSRSFGSQQFQVVFDSRITPEWIENY